jgi:hypothetical protein
MAKKKLIRVPYPKAHENAPVRPRNRGRFGYRSTASTSATNRLLSSAADNAINESCAPAEAGTHYSLVVLLDRKSFSARDLHGHVENDPVDHRWLAPPVRRGSSGESVELKPIAHARLRVQHADTHGHSITHHYRVNGGRSNRCLPGHVGILPRFLRPITQPWAACLFPRPHACTFGRETQP